MATKKQNAINTEVVINATGMTIGGGSTTIKTATIEDDAVISQDYSSDATPTFDTVKINDSDDSHTLELKFNEAEAAGDRVLNLKVEGGDRTLDLNESLTIGDGEDGTLTFSVAAKTITVEDDAIVDQDLTTDATAVAFGSVQLGGGGATPTEFSTDGTFAGNSDAAVPTEKAVLTLVNAQPKGYTTSVLTADLDPLVIGTCYIMNDAVDLCSCVLPATAAVGDRIQIVGKGATGWKVTAAAGDTIVYGNLTTIAGGYIASTHERDAKEFICTVADSEWQIPHVGNVEVEIS